MNRIALPIVVIVLVGIALVLFAFIVRNQPSVRDTTKIETSVSAPPLSPTQILVTLSGTIESISETEYKDSTLIRVDDSNVYITNKTDIEDQENNPVEKEEIEEGMLIVVVGENSERGIEAITAAVILPTPTPTTRPQPTRTPTPQTPEPTS